MFRPRDWIQLDGSIRLTDRTFHSGPLDDLFEAEEDDLVGGLLRPRGVGVSMVFPGFIRDAGMFHESGAKLPGYVGTKRPEDVADAVVSAGNTGAMLAASLLEIRRLPGVFRPAIAVVLPARRGPSVLIDAGANAESRA